jgi:hypothetical protein
MSPVLPLQDMHLRHHGLTTAVAANNTEAATVCLSRHSTPPTTFSVESHGTTQDADAHWNPPDARTLGAWNNRTDTTEMGAYACALAAVELVRGVFAIRRAETGTGADYYIGPPGAGVEDLEHCHRIEVSGVDTGGDREVRQRVGRKVEQARHGDSSLPAVAAVVGFGARLIVLADVESA